MLYEFISLHRAEILTRCLNDLEGQYPNRQDGELLQGLSCFVDELVATLARDAGHPEIETDDGSLADTMVQRHGVIRRTQGFDLSRVMHEYGLVCEMVTQMASEHEQSFNAREYQLLNRCIDEAIAMAIVSFEETRSAEERDRAEHLGFGS
jgi:RsbT co-antagonist protein rsbRD N-terminal domain